MRRLSRWAFLWLFMIGVAGLVGSTTLPVRADAPRLQVYKQPWCGCCGAWADHMSAAGFDVQVTDVEDLQPVKSRYRVAADLRSCHTAVIEDYVIEGHVPAQDVMRLLKDRPAAIGLAVPGMPVGSPGMEQGGRQDPYQVILFTESERRIFARY